MTDSISNSQTPVLTILYKCVFTLEQADTMVTYLNAFKERLGLNVQYDTLVMDIRRHMHSSHDRRNSNKEEYFTMRDQRSKLYLCK